MTDRHYDQQQKLTILKKAREIGLPEAARIAGVHHSTVYRWQNKLDSLREEGFLQDTPNRPGRGKKKISKEQKEAILGVWQTHPEYGPEQVRSQLRRQGITISIRTIRKVMQAAGYKPKQKKEKKAQSQRFEAGRPLELAQMDILELHINKARVYLLLLIDDFSRFILGFRLIEQTSVNEVITLVREAVNQYGKMEELLTDRGFVFYSWRGINRFERYLEEERIDHTHASPHHPQTLGKVEALNRRVKTELFGQKHFSTLQQADSALRDWVEHYNHKRPHQGLGGLLVPAERFYGQTEKVLDEIANRGDVTYKDSSPERSIINLVLDPEGNLTLYLLGRPVVIKGGSHDQGTD